MITRNLMQQRGGLGSRAQDILKGVGELTMQKPSPIQTVQMGQPLQVEPIGPAGSGGLPQRSVPVQMPAQPVMESTEPTLSTDMMLPKLKAAAQMKQMVDADPAIEQDPSFQDRAKRFFGSRENMYRLAMAFNTMRLNPDQGLANFLGKQIEGIDERQRTNVTAQRVAERLREMGDETAARIAEENPAMAGEVLKQVLQRRYSKDSVKEFAPATDPLTGQRYIIRDGKRVDVEGAIGLTADQEREAEVEKDTSERNWRLSTEKSAQAMDSASNIQDSLSQYQQALIALNQGAESGALRQYMPAFTSATSNLRSAASKLGITVINSATFGALSQSELDLAMKTPLDLSLKPEQLRQQIVNKMRAQERVYDAIMNKAAELSSMPYNKFIQLQKQRYDERKPFLTMPNDGVIKQDDWYLMTFDEKRQYIEASK